MEFEESAGEGRQGVTRNKIGQLMIKDNMRKIRVSDINVSCIFDTANLKCLKNYNYPSVREKIEYGMRYN